MVDFDSLRSQMPLGLHDHIARWSNLILKDHAMSLVFHDAYNKMVYFDS